MQKRMNVKQIAVIILTFTIIMLGSFAFSSEIVYADSIVANGSAGTNILWTLDDKGVLTLTGSGEMNDYSNGSSPWYSNRKSVLSVKIGEGITYIGSWAFATCQNMTTVEAASNISVATFAFYNCTGLQTFTDANGLNNVGYYAFYDCKALTTIPTIKGITDSSAFNGCSGIKKAVIGEGVKSIGISAFSGCTGLESVTLPDGLESIGASAFNNCSSLMEITLPSTITSIGNSAFAGCSSLTDVYYMSNSEDWGKIPAFTGAETIGTILHCLTASGAAGTNIAWSLFDNGLLILSGTGSMNDYTFPEYSSTAPWYSVKEKIEQVIVYSGITNISKCAFLYCTNLKKVILPSGISYIGTAAFCGCSSLSDIILPDDLAGINDDAFRNCTSLTDISIPGGIGGVNKYSFAGCTNLESVTFGKGIKSIGEYAFQNDSQLTEINLPEGLLTINTGAFWGCTGIEYIFLPSTLATINSSFSSSDTLKAVYYMGDHWETIPYDTAKEPLNSKLHGLTASGSVNEGSKWYLFSDGFLYINGNGVIDDYTNGGAPWYSYRDSIITVRIDSGITHIGNFAFSWCSELDSVEAKSQVSVGEGAFYNCAKLVSFSDNNGLQSVGGDCFLNCEKLKTVPFVSGNIDSGAFSHCSGMEKIELQEGIQSIGNGAFWLCTSLSEISIPSSVKTIGAEAFYECQKLALVTLSAGITSIGNYAFRDCCALSGITLPQSINTLGTGIFRGCSQITIMAIPSSIQTVSAETFYGCTKLSGVIIPKNVTQIADSAFYQCGSLADVCFLGTLAEWDEVSVGTNNEPLDSATFQFGLSETAATAETLINAIGDVTYDITCWNKIKAAREQYDKLSELDRASVESYSTLATAEAEFFAMEAKDTLRAALLYSSTTDGHSSIAALSGGDMYYSVRGGDVTAPDIDGFTFVGWYQDYDYTDPTAAAVSNELTYHVNPTAATMLTAVYSPTKSFTITYESETKSLTAGAEASFTFAEEARRLLYWSDDNGNILSKDTVYKFIVTRNMTIHAVSVPAGNAGDRAMVIFEDESGHMISAKVYDIYDTIVFPTAPAVTGKEFDHWDMTANEIKKEMETSDMIRVKAVYIDAT